MIQDEITIAQKNEITESENFESLDLLYNLLGDESHSAIYEIKATIHKAFRLINDKVESLRQLQPKNDNEHSLIVKLTSYYNEEKELLISLLPKEPSFMVQYKDNYEFQDFKKSFDNYSIKERMKIMIETPSQSEKVREYYNILDIIENR